MSAHDAQHTDRENARAVPSVADQTNALKQVSRESVQTVAQRAGSPAEAQNTGKGAPATDRTGRRKGNPTVI